MENLQIAPAVSEEQIREIGDLAQKIWREHYTTIIGEHQVDYMLNKFQSPKSIAAQIKDDGYHYFLLEWNNHHAGYLAIKYDSSDLFLSKIYIDQEFRRHHLAAQAVDYLKEICKEKHFTRIWLTVNKGNCGSIAAYERLGFSISSELVSNIGSGYVMDDYMMELIVK